MIDQISFTLPGGGLPSGPRYEAYRNGGFYSGNLENLRITQYPDAIMCSGSLAKYLNGENCTPLTLSGVRNALNKLEARTGWSLNKATVKQVEIGCTVITKHPADRYLSLIGRIPRHKLKPVIGKKLQTVSNEAAGRGFIVYDKAEESRKDIPPLYSGCNLLRMELRYRKGVKKELGVFSPWQLAEKPFYKDLRSRFWEYYQRVPKAKKPVLDVSNIRTPKDIDRVLQVAGIQEIGEDHIMGIISSLGQAGQLSHADRARSSIRELLNNSLYAEPVELIQELDNLVWQFVSGAT